MAYNWRLALSKWINHPTFKCGILFLFILFVPYTDNQAQIKYTLSRYSEEYNTHYLYCGDFTEQLNDTTIFINAPLPKSLVIEIGALEKGESTAIIYNDVQYLIIKNYNGYLFVDGDRIGGKNKPYIKLSLYFVDERLIVYQDDQLKKTLRFNLDPLKKIGLKISKKEGYVCRMWNCYEPIPFNVADYGAALEEGILRNTRGVRVSPHNVGELYSLTLPTDITYHSKRAIRFEYRYNDTKKVGVSGMQRGRSEISGVFSFSQKNKWIIEYDLYIPKETQNDDVENEIITQLHEGSSTPTSPTFCLYMRGGYLCCAVRGDSRNLLEWVHRSNVTYTESRNLKYLQKERWYHIKVYVKEGWRIEDRPLTLVWIDNELLFESDTPNCFKYTEKSGNHYDYLKFGVYKGSWLTTQTVDFSKQKRIYYFDNYIVKY